MYTKSGESEPLIRDFFFLPGGVSATRVYPNPDPNSCVLCVKGALQLLINRYG